MGRQANWVEVVGIGTYMESPQPHYWVKRDGKTTLESIVRLSPRSLDDKLNRHGNRRNKKRASDATTPEVAANPTEVTQ